MILTSLVLTLVSALAVSSVPPGAKVRPRIVALGDSLTSGRGIGQGKAFPALLQQRLEDEGLDYDVINAGVSGDTSGRALQRYEAALDGDVRVLILALGANDGLRGVPVAQVDRNISQIIERAQARGITVLLCGMEALPIHGWEYTLAFHKLYMDLAARFHVTLVPFILRNVIGNPDLMQPDRAHPNAEGAKLIAANVWPYLKAALQPSTVGSK